MAILELCDLCAGKSSNKLAEVVITGVVDLSENKELPTLPVGFKYRDETTPPGLKITSRWSNLGKIEEIEFVNRPETSKKIRVTYDLCGDCLDKLVKMLETMRQHYHLEKKKVELLDYKEHNPFKLLGFDPDED